ncbi:MAG: hypothetical protein EA427_11180 [Spirochaetaceae bacterium]|nr:MAG: hypothetical protein EA427_11180 [Spirochaetaceae bacterium]
MVSTQKQTDTATVLSTMFTREGVAFSRPEEGWKMLAEHVDKHKYWLSEQLGREITWQEAVFSWYENVMIPLKRVVGGWEFRSAFPNQNLGDLFLAVSDHWYFLKEENPDVDPQTVARSFVTHFGHGLSRWFSRFLLT